MVTRKPVGGHSVPGAPSYVPFSPPVPGTPTVTAPTPTTPAVSPPILLHASLNAPPPMPPPPPPAQEDDLFTSHSHSQVTAKPIDGTYDSDEDEDEWDKSDSSEDEWDLADNDERKMTPDAGSDLPAPLRISRPPSQEPVDKGKAKADGVPNALRIGPPGGIPTSRQHSNESIPVGSVDSNHSNNPWRTQSPPKDVSQAHAPFLKAQTTGETLFGAHNSSAVWSRGVSPQQTGSIAELPSVNSPVEQMDNLHISELSSISSPIDKHDPLLLAHLEAPSEQPTVPVSDPFGAIPAEGLVGTQHAWKDEEGHLPPPGPPPGWQGKGKSAETPQGESVTGALLPDFDDEPKPSLPPRTSTLEQEEAPPKPPRPEAGSSTAAAAGATEDPLDTLQKQRNQTYQIKKIRWFGDRVRMIRVSPILIQNANGPCPLLALVNALTLSTPENVDTALVDALRSREQISLGFLLDAVFEELMSGRRNEGAQELPDVGELYSFLIALHTGMNVNPRYTQRDDVSSIRQPGSFEQTKEMRLYGTFSIPLLHGWIPEPDSEAYVAFDRSAKTYEDAQNIQFYEEELEAKLSTTGLNTEEQHMFEDLISIKQFQNMWPTQLTEYGLNIIRESLKPGQFAILFRNDHFSTVYKEPRSDSLLTVVTDAGYASHDEIVWESLVDINGMATEHFSGDFRPVSHSAPAAPSTAPTVGARNSSLGGQNVQSMLDVDQGWQQVGGKKGKRVKVPPEGPTSGQQPGVIGGSSSSSAPIGVRAAAAAAAAGMSQSEQEDADLALALQLQEEEDDRQRRDQSERRNRQLSSQVLDQTTPPTPISRPLIPPRRQGPPQFTTSRPTNTGEEAPPPSYEDASKDRRFVPPPDHPSSPHAPLGGGGGPSTPTGPSAATPVSGNRRESSAYAQAAGMGGGRPSMSTNDLPSMGGRRGSRPSPLISRIPDQRPYRQQGGRLGGPMNPVGGPGSKEEKCIVM